MYITALRAVTYWRKLTRFMERGYMADVSEHLSSYDILPVLEAYCPGEIQGFRFMEVTTFLTYLRKTSLVCKVTYETSSILTHA